MAKETGSLEQLQNEVRLTAFIEFEQLYLLKDAKKEIGSTGELESVERLFASDEQIEHLIENGSLDEFDQENSLQKSYKAKSPEEQALHRFFKIRFKSQAGRDAFFESNKENKKVKSLTEDQIAEVNATPVPVPNDTEYNQLWGLEKIKTRHVWDCTKGCEATVAVIDTGVDYTHDDINNNMYEITPTWKGLNTTVLPFPPQFFDPMDGHSDRHGTHVAGTIGAERNNLFAVTGVAPSSKILAIKGLHDSGFGLFSQLAEGIRLASLSLLNVDVINNSWGPTTPGNPPFPMMNIAIGAATSAGIAVVFSAGNTNIDAGGLYPQSHPDVIVVGATDNTDTKAALSNYGSKVDVCAPGVQILSLKQASVTNTLSGTSMAAPHVSGMIALIKSRYPDLDVPAIRQIVRTYVDPYTSPEYLGTGRISLEHLEELLCGCGCSPCDLDQIIQARDLENKRLKKFKTIRSLNCGRPNPDGCLPVRIGDFKPCFSFHWGDSALDNIETHDTEIGYLRVCNEHSNLGYRGLTVSEIIINPTQVLPNGDRSIRIVPEELICFGDLGPCACATREVTLLTRSARPGVYTVTIKFCVEGVEVLGNNQFEDQIELTLINS